MNSSETVNSTESTAESAVARALLAADMSLDQFPTELTEFVRLALEIAGNHGCQVYDVEFGTSGGSRVLRLYLDKAVAGGVGLEDCALVARALNEVLDANEELIPGGQYNLEVSSPGVERPLRLKWHFQAAVGQKIWLKLAQTVRELGSNSEKYAGHKQLKALMVATEADSMQLDLDGETVRIPFSAVEKSHVLYEFGSAKKDHKKGNKKR
jgi:ribosome maturation factor RimP